MTDTATWLAQAEQGTLDLLDGDLYLESPPEVWRWLRDNAPVYRDEANGMWGISRHADILAVEKDAATFSNAQGYRPLLGADPSLISFDDPTHHRRRALVSRKFTPRAVGTKEDDIRKTVIELIEAVAPAGRADVVADWAAPLPAIMITRLLGWPDDMWPKVKHWSEATIPLGGGPRYMNEEGLLAHVDYSAHIGPLVQEKRANPGDDVMSTLVHATLDGCPLDDPQLHADGLLLIDGGAETTRTVIAHTIRELATHPDAWQRLAADRSLLSSAVEEFIRWVTPIVNFRRTATRDVELHGVPIKEGDQVLLLYPSANRDEAVFDDPDRFDIGRHPNHHVAFGFGTHFCLGAALARLEIRVFFDELVARVHDLRLDGEPTYLPNAFVRGVLSMPVTFTAT